MRVTTVSFICFLACLASAIPALAQFGHPLKGSWSGDWGPSKTERNRVLLEFNWDGKGLTGTLNPGPDAAPMQKVSLEPPGGGVAGAANGWALHFEADVKDSTGKTVHVVVDGTMENIGAYRRFITGSWTEGTKKGYFEVVRN